MLSYALKYNGATFTYRVVDRTLVEVKEGDFWKAFGKLNEVNTSFEPTLDPDQTNYRSSAVYQLAEPWDVFLDLAGREYVCDGVEKLGRQTWSSGEQIRLVFSESGDKEDFRALNSQNERVYAAQMETESGTPYPVSYQRFLWVAGRFHVESKLLYTESHLEVNDQFIVDFDRQKISINETVCVFN